MQLRVVAILTTRRMIARAEVRMPGLGMAAAGRDLIQGNGSVLNVKDFGFEIAYG